MKFGLHVSIAKSLDTAVDNAKSLGCDTFQMFTRNPRGWKYTALDPEEVESFREKLKQTQIGPPVDHMPYLPNLACPEDEIYEKSAATLVSEVERCVQLGVPYIVTHLGSHLGRGREVGLQRLTTALNLSLKKATGELQILLENMAGQANSMGSTFKDIKEILDRLKTKERVGVCLDTCLPPGSLVFSDEMPTPIEDVAAFDTILSAGGTQDRVVKLWRRTYSGKLVSIKPEGLPWFSATASHPILCLKPDGWQYRESKPWKTRRVGEPTWVYARDVKPGYFVVMPKLTCHEPAIIDFRPHAKLAQRDFPFPSTMRLTHSFAELLGFYLAEGFTFMGHWGRGDRGKVYFAFGHHEKTLIDRLQTLVEDLFYLRTWIDDRGTATKVCVGSNVLTRFFRSNFGPRAGNKKIPPFMLHAHPELVKTFLLAYLKGDGHVNRRGLAYTTASRTVAYQLIHLLARLDIRATVRRHAPTNNSIQGRILRGSGWYVVHLGGHEAKKLGFAYDFPTSPPCRIIRDRGHFYVPVKETSAESYTGPVYNLTTESGTFTAPFIVTHNCHLYASGYDVQSQRGVDQTLAKFDDIIGFENLRVVHLNDSKGGLGSGLDRHEHIGKGYIGVKGFKAFLHHPAIRELPLILETPVDTPDDNMANLQMARKLAK